MGTWGCPSSTHSEVLGGRERASAFNPCQGVASDSRGPYSQRRLLIETWMDALEKGLGVSLWLAG